MNTKIQLKSNNYQSFGGIFYVNDELKRLSFDKVIDTHLGLRSKFAGYQYSEIIQSLFYLFLCGGDHIEDLSTHLNELRSSPSINLPSPDTVLRGIKALSIPNKSYTNQSKTANYEFNTADTVNELLLKLLFQTNQLSTGVGYTLDFDHQFIPTEKYDTKYSYKNARGYFPGIATIGNLIVGVENRDGNTNVRFCQKDTLKRIFTRLTSNNITINKARMDCGSYSQDIIEEVDKHTTHFYIRASNYQSLAHDLKDNDNWEEVEINFEKYTLTSIPFTAFAKDKNYRLVVQRIEHKKDEPSLFGPTYTHRCILTNDHDSSKEDIVKFYNQRGASERNFDEMNNDFGWKHLPCSFMNQNTVFLLLTAMVKNFYHFIVDKVAKVMEDIKPNYRIKRFIFRFITVPAKWIKTARMWKLNIYSQKPYDILFENG